MRDTEVLASKRVDIFVVPAAAQVDAGCIRLDELYNLVEV